MGKVDWVSIHGPVLLFLSKSPKTLEMNVMSAELKYGRLTGL
jgi:hypothetical protein